MHYLYTDGGSRGNPGNSAIGYFIFESDQPSVTTDSRLVDFGGKYLGIATNNNAEYTALINGLTLAQKNGITELSCILDSELVVKQLNGVYKISSPEIKVLADKVKELSKWFKKITFTHVLREKNKFADKLVNLILDTQANV